VTFTHADFRMGSDVYSSDDKNVGTLEYLVVENHGYDLHYIVVAESSIASGHHWYQGANMLVRDAPIPISAVASATHDRVTLNLSLSEIRHLPPYVTFQLTPAKPMHTVLEAFSAAIGSGSSVLGPTSWPYTDTHHKADEELEISKGEPVMLGSTGRVLGRIHDVVYDDNELVGVVIRHSGFFEPEVLLQVRFITRGNDFVLIADISEKDIARLKPFVPER
jgi:uncharacterized protein YrrD